MIQLYRKGRGMERLPFEYGSLNEVFTNLDSVLKDLVENKIDLENIFYTLNDSGAGDREFKRFTHLAFDIDGAAIERWEEYLPLVRQLTLTETENITAVCSGHGLHFLIELTPGCQFDDESLFPKKKLQYRALCQKLEGSMGEAGLPGKVDSSIFDRARIMRLPGTRNVKPNKPIAEAKLLRLGERPADVDMAAISGIEFHQGGKTKTSTKETKARGPKESIDWFGANDDESILSGCDAIKLAATHPEKVDEPLWYAIDSIVGRLKDGKKLIHQWAKAHPSYDEKAVESKINQALEASGPRTCESIEGLWDGCKACKFYKVVSSPIQIKGPDFISTESTGFHTLTLSPAGHPVKKPCYEDLMKFYRKAHPYKSIADSKRTRVFRGGSGPWGATYYEEIADTELEAFAQENFRPFADTKMTREFANLIQRTNTVKPDWFKTSTEKRLNLANGVLNLDKMILVPHDPKFGFLSQLDYEYDPQAKSPLFDKFLTDITCGDKELETAIIQFLAYAISGERCINEKVLVLHGSGANGKSTLIRIMKAIFGKSMSFFQPEEIASQFDRYRLEGALACVIEEMPSWKDKAFWEKIKGLASGGEITVSKKFKDSYEIENRTKFIITCNELPGGTDPSHGYFRRLLIVPFNATFDGTSRDPRIADRIISSELPGVLNRLLAAYVELTKNDFIIPEPGASAQALGEYKVERDNTLAWLQETFRPATPEEIPVRLPANSPTGLRVDKQGLPLIRNNEAYALYRTWCEEHGYTAHQILNGIHFMRRIKELLKKEKTVLFTQRRIDGDMPKVIVGLVPKNYGLKDTEPGA